MIWIRKKTRKTFLWIKRKSRKTNIQNDNRSDLMCAFVICVIKKVCGLNENTLSRNKQLKKVNKETLCALEIMIALLHAMNATRHGIYWTIKLSWYVVKVFYVNKSIKRSWHLHIEHIRSKTELKTIMTHWMQYEKKLFVQNLQG